MLSFSQFSLSIFSSFPKENNNNDFNNLIGTYVIPYKHLQARGSCGKWSVEALILEDIG